jgi:hypothetical protein
LYGYHKQQSQSTSIKGLSNRNADISNMKNINAHNVGGVPVGGPGESAFDR